MIKERFKVRRCWVVSGHPWLIETQICLRRRPLVIPRGGKEHQTLVADGMLTEFVFGQGFNDGLEELCKIQKAWAIPDMEQRDKIRRAQKTIVKETYGAFLSR